MLKVIEAATNRREFLVRSAATAAGAFMSIGLPVLGSETAEAEGMSAFTPSIWFTLTPDGKVTMHIVKCEMGQHIGTGLAQVIAEELEVNWADVRLDSPLESVENFAIYGLAYTVNSGSITTEFNRLSRAGAAGRMALIEAGAKALGARESDCSAANSRVIDSASGRSISYGEIIQNVNIDRKFAYPDDFRAIKIKPRGSYKIIGQSLAALDIPAKTNGQAKYGIDVFLPNMLYGSLAIPRTRYASKVTSVDDSDARKIPGFVKAVTIDDSMGKCTGWVVALAENFPAAIKAARALKIEAEPGPYGGLSTEGLVKDYAHKVATGTGANWVLEGDVDKALGEAEQILEMEYTTDMVCHATMEPLNATAEFVNGEWHIYTGTQSTSFARMTLTAYLSKVLDKKPEDLRIFVHESLVGGGFGGKQDYDELLAAAYCVKEAGRPVKLIQTRESNFATSFPRTPTYHKVKAGLKNGALVAMGHDICCGWMGPRFAVGKKYGSAFLQLEVLGRQERGHRSVVDRRQRSLVRYREQPRAGVRQRPHHVRRTGERAAHRVELVQHVRCRVVHRRGGARAQARSAGVPARHAQRQGQRPRHSQCRLSGGHAVGLLYGPIVDFAALGDRQVLAALRIHDHRRRAQAGELPPGGGRQSGLGRKAAPAQHRHGHRCLRGGGAAKPDLGRRHRGSHGRSQDRRLRDQPDHHRHGSGHRDQSARRDRAGSGLGAVGGEPGHVGAAHHPGRRIRAVQLQ